MSRGDWISGFLVGASVGSSLVVVLLFYYVYIGRIVEVTP